MFGAVYDSAAQVCKGRSPAPCHLLFLRGRQAELPGAVLPANSRAPKRCMLPSWYGSSGGLEAVSDTARRRLNPVCVIPHLCGAYTTPLLRFAIRHGPPPQNDKKWPSLFWYARRYPPCLRALVAAADPGQRMSVLVMMRRIEPGVISTLNLAETWLVTTRDVQSSESKP